MTKSSGDLVVRDGSPAAYGVHVRSNLQEVC